MRRVKTYLISLSLLAVSSISLSQTTTSKDFIRSVQEADMHFYYYEDFIRSAALYEAIWLGNRDNHNIAAKLAISFLNAGYRKREAIPLLLFASENIARNDSQYTEYGTTAPVETQYYLAYAYQLNDSLVKAIEIYSGLKKTASRTENFRLDYIDMQIAACELALELKKNPARVTKSLFTEILADYPGAANGALSANDSVFIFNVRSGEGVKVYCSFKENGWKMPVEITRQLGGYPEMIVNSVTHDGSFLVIYFYNGVVGNLFYSERTGQNWSKIRKFPKPVNTKYWESHGQITPDGRRLFFTSNRPGGFGELDIYVSERTRQGGWSDPANAGSTINTAYNETTPFFDEESSTLYFSSEGHGGVGGYDYFSSLYRSGKWNKPELLPYPLNTTGNNLFLTLAPGGKSFIINSDYKDNPYGNIFYAAVETPQHPGDYYITATVNTGDGVPVDTAEVKVMLHDREKTGKAPEVIKSGTRSEFSIPVKSGGYLVTTNYPGYVTDSLFINIKDDRQISRIDNQIVLVPREVGSGAFLMVRSILFGFDSYGISPEAGRELDRLALTLSGRQNLVVEVTGYTDATGSADYNRRLAARRADAVVAYLNKRVSGNIRFVSKAAGAVDFIAINRNPDGSDNPAGRRYNRRVSIGIVNPGEGITIVPDRFVPKHLRHPQSERFGIVLTKNRENLSPDYFRNIGQTGNYFVRPVRTDTLNYYVLGEFTDRASATGYLDSVKSSGFGEAYITSLYELLADEPPSLVASSTAARTGTVPTYTIQLFAGRKIADLSIFGDLPITVLLGRDGLFRYVTGEYQGYSEARKQIDLMRNRGFRDAYIRDYRLLMDETKEIVEKRP
jgi:outer membrane protein OmpA-like peptidoglycan-associated protein